MGILSVIGKSLTKKTTKGSSKDVAKRGSEVMGRRDEKFMGMADEVQPKRLSGPKAEEAKEAAKRSGGGKAIAAGVAATGAAGATMLSGRDKEDKKEPTKVVAASRMSEGRVTKADADPVIETSKVKEASKPSTFGAAFKEARAAGKDVFTYNGKKYTTEMAGEKKATPKASEKATGVREGRNENIGDDTRERARAFVEAKMGPRALAAEDDATKRLAKGGVVMANCGASVPPAQKRK